MQDTMKRKYTCDRSVTVTRLEDLVQDAAVGSGSRHLINSSSFHVDVVS